MTKKERITFLHWNKMLKQDNATVVYSERANTDVNLHVLKNRNQISENDTTSSPERLKYEFFLLICCSTWTLLSNVGL